MIDINTQGIIDLIRSVNIKNRQDLSTQAERALLDYLAAICAAREESAVKQLFTYARSSGRASDWALAYGFASHYLDYDDAQANIAGHLSTVIYSALLSIADPSLEVDDFLAAYVAGTELEGLLGKRLNPAHRQQGWHSTGTIGPLGAAAALIRLLKLSDEQAAQLISMSATQSSGMGFQSGSETKPLHAGFAAASALRSYELLQLGIKADMCPFRDDIGWLQTIGNCMLDLEKLQNEWLNPGQIISPGLWMKQHQYCSAAICAVAGCSKLWQAGLRMKNIQKIVFHFSPGADHGLRFLKPRTGREGQFSVEYVAWQILTFGKIDDAFFHLDQVPIDFCKALSKMYRCDDLAPLEQWERAVPVSAVDCHGRTWQADVRDPAGSPERPFTKAQQRAKLVAATDEDIAEKIIELMEDKSAGTIEKISQFTRNLSQKNILI